jgi:hypothetical protein
LDEKVKRGMLISAGDKLLKEAETCSPGSEERRSLYDLASSAFDKAAASDPDSNDLSQLHEKKGEADRLAAETYPPGSEECKTRIRLSYYAFRDAAEKVNPSKPGEGARLNEKAGKAAKLAAVTYLPGSDDYQMWTRWSYYAFRDAAEKAKAGSVARAVVAELSEEAGKAAKLVAETYSYGSKDHQMWTRWSYFSFKEAAEKMASASPIDLPRMAELNGKAGEAAKLMAATCPNDSFERREWARAAYASFSTAAALESDPGKMKTFNREAANAAHLVALTYNSETESDSSQLWLDRAGTSYRLAGLEKQEATSTHSSRNNNIVEKGKSQSILEASSKQATTESGANRKDGSSRLVRKIEWDIPKTQSLADAETKAETEANDSYNKAFAKYYEAKKYDPSARRGLYMETIADLKIAIACYDNMSHGVGSSSEAKRLHVRAKVASCYTVIADMVEDGCEAALYTLGGGDRTVEWYANEAVSIYSGVLGGSGDNRAERVLGEKVAKEVALLLADAKERAKRLPARS